MKAKIAALTVSDPFCVQSHKAEFLELLNGDLELLFANEEEAMMLLRHQPARPNYLAFLLLSGSGAREVWGKYAFAE